MLSKGGTPQRLAAMKEDRNNAAAMLGPPFSIAAAKEGFHSLGTVADVLGPYQGNSVVVLRSWAKANGATLVNYLAAMIEADRWAFDPAHRAELASIMLKRLKVDPETMQASLEAAVGPKGGLAKDARFDLTGFKEVLRLRAEFAGAPGAVPPPPEKYIDLSFYDKALAGL